MTALTIRTDSAVEHALEYLLARREGETRSEIVRAAILDLERETRRAQMQAESTALMEDPAYRAEMRAVAAEMESLRAW